MYFSKTITLKGCMHRYFVQCMPKTWLSIKLSFSKTYLGGMGNLTDINEEESTLKIKYYTFIIFLNSQYK